MDCVIYKENVLSVSNDCTLEYNVFKRDGVLHREPIVSIKDIYNIKDDMVKGDRVGIICDDGNGYFCIFANDNTFKVERKLNELEINTQKKIWQNMKVK